jgi:hypothetical protein
LGQKSIDLGKTPGAGSKQRKEYDMRQILARPGFESLSNCEICQKLLLMARTVPRHQIQRGEGAISHDQALGQPGATSSKSGGDEFVAR